MSNIRFGCSALNGTNKAGILAKYSDNYYTMVVGGLNIFNSAGQWYSYEGAKALFESSSQFMRRVSRGALRGEVGHPRQEKGQSFDEYVQRIMEIRESNVCVHFKEIFLDFNSMKDANGKAVVAIMAKLIPSGPHGAALEKSLENKNENVCFSIRSFTKDFYDRGIEVRELKNIVTFDAVNEPGIAIANKYQAPGLENLTENTITQSQLNRIIKNDSGTNNLATESSKMIAKETMETLGWNLPKGVNASFTKW